MQGRQEIQPKLFYQVSLEDLVPANNYYRRLLACLDLGFLYGATAHCYGTKVQGRAGQQARPYGRPDVQPPKV